MASRITGEDVSREVKDNYRHFLEHLASLLGTQRGQWCLLHRQQIIGFYPTMEDAYREGVAKYPNRRFSIQEVCNEPLNMGSHAVAL